MEQSVHLVRLSMGTRRRFRFYNPRGPFDRQGGKLDTDQRGWLEFEGDFKLEWASPFYQTDWIESGLV